MSEDAVRAMVNKRYRAAAVITDYFPLRMRNGAVMRGFDARCGTCNAKILRGAVRGELRNAPGGCYRVTALGMCGECKNLESLLFHVIPVGDDDFRIANLASRGWVESYACEVVEFPRRNDGTLAITKIVDGEAVQYVSENSPLFRVDSSPPIA